jgi:hypothetical protein
MLKKSASFVLASLRSSTCRSARLASSLVAALLNGLFEHPADNEDLSQSMCQGDSLAVFERFLVHCLNISGFLRYRGKPKARTMISTISPESILIHH